MKHVKSVILVILSVFLLTGCVKEEIKMSINKDKTMKFEVQTLISDSLLSDNSSSMISEANELEKRGYTVTQKKEDGYSGYLISKSFDNIDELSKNNGEEVNLGDITEENFDMSRLFSYKKGLFRDSYTANFKFKNNYDSSMYETNNNVELEEETNNTSEEENTEEADFSDFNSLASLTGEMSFKYVVNVPYRVGSNNASKVSEDKKTLTWNLDSKDLSEINYTFYIYNMTLIYIAGGVGLLVLILIIVLLIKLKNKKSTNETLIHTDYDESIVGKITETQTPLENIPNTSENLEYTMPGSVANNAEVLTGEEASPIASNQDELIQTNIEAPHIPQGADETPIISQVETTTPISDNNINTNV